jgi:hypothetical protein
MMEGESSMAADVKSIEVQTQLALAVLAAAFVKTLQEFLPPDEALEILVDGCQDPRKDGASAK